MIGMGKPEAECPVEAPRVAAAGPQGVGALFATGETGHDVVCFTPKKTQESWHNKPKLVNDEFTEKYESAEGYERARRQRAWERDFENFKFVGDPHEQ